MVKVWVRVRVRVRVLVFLKLRARDGRPRARVVRSVVDETLRIVVQ